MRLLLKFISLSIGAHIIAATSISVIDMSSFLSESPSQDDINACVRDIDLALRSVGAFIATGVPINEIEALNAAKMLFSLDTTALNDVAIKKDGFMRGYIPFGQESGLQTHFEPKEGYSYGFDWSSEVELQKSNMLHGDNLWPQVDLNWGKMTLQDLFRTEISIAEKLTEAMSMALNEGNHTALSAYVDPKGSTSVMRLFHYFATDKLSEKLNIGSKTIMGSSPHTDWGYLTLILQDRVGGLQIKYNNEWIDVPYIHNSLIVNAGDFLSLISGSVYHSPIHRVLAPKEIDRTSFVLFYYPNFNTPMDADLFNRMNVAIGVDANLEDHNTLFSLASNSDKSNNKKTFGEYIIQKWKEVKVY